MKIDTKYNGTIIGGIFSGLSLLLTITFIVPILSVLPGVLIESIMSQIVNSEPYSNVGIATVWTLIILLLGSLALFLIYSRRKKLTNKKIVGIMFVEYFIVHSLGFYIYWATSLNFRNDGQLIFGVIESFPVSSFSFVIFGLLFDLMKNNDLK